MRGSSPNGRSTGTAHALPLSGRQPDERSFLARSLELLGRHDEALAVIRGIIWKPKPSDRFIPTPADSVGVLARLAARRGDQKTVTRLDAELAAMSGPYLRGTNTRYRAEVAALLGDRERAVALLRDAIAEGQRRAGMHTQLGLLGLHGYAPFEALLGPKD